MDFSFSVVVLLIKYVPMWLFAVFFYLLPLLFPYTISNNRIFRNARTDVTTGVPQGNIPTWSNAITLRTIIVILLYHKI